MDQLSSTVNPHQLDTLPSNAIQNLKNDGHCMTVITRWGKQTIDPPIPYGVDDEMSRNVEVVELVVSW